MNAIKLITYGVLVIAISCSSAKNALNEGNDMSKVGEEKAQETPFEIIVQESHGGPEVAQCIEFREENTLNHFYTKVNMTRRPGLPVPEVDFEKETIVALCLGEKTTSGYSITIDHIEQTDEGQVVWVKEIGPGPDDMVAMVICQPFTIVKFPKKGEKILFKKVK